MNYAYLDFAMAVIVCLLGVFDSSTTESRIGKYGLEVELNPTIRWMAPKIGLPLAIGLGIMMPTLAISTALVALGWTTALAVWLGAKLITARYQMLSLKLEAEMDRQMAALQVRGATTASSSSKPPENSEGNS